MASTTFLRPTITTLTQTESDAQWPCRKALTHLLPVLDILSRFHHRNKNQHRLSKWFSQADMLRRQLQKLIKSLQDGLLEEERELARQPKKSKSKSSKELTKAKGSFGAGSAGGDLDIRDKFGIHQRAVYLRRILVPRAFLAFTQATADRQFAHLGLMLLGVLAQVDGAVASFAPGAGEGEGVGRGDTTEQAPGIECDGAGEIGYGSRAIDWEFMGEQDVGVAISRDEFLAATSERTIAEQETWTEEMTKIPSTKMGVVSGGTPSRQAQQEQPRKRSRVADHQDDKSAEGIVGNNDKVTTAKKKKTTDKEDQKQSPGLDESHEMAKVFSSLLPKRKSKKVMIQRPSQTSTWGLSPVEVKGQETSVSTTTSTILTSSPTTTAGDKEKKKTKKKKKKGGDEFDDIFGGLL